MSVVILPETDFMIAVNNGTVSHYITVHVPGVFETGKAYLGKRKKKKAQVSNLSGNTKAHILHHCIYNTLWATAVCSPLIFKNSLQCMGHVTF